MTPAILVPLIVFGSVVAIVKMALDYKKWTKENYSVGADRTLRTSELREIIDEAVREATEPLERRIDALERRLPQDDRQRELAASEEDEHG